MRIFSVFVLFFFTFPGNVLAHDFSTFESVRAVVTCMAELGAQTEENLYTCTCKHDVIASKMTFTEFEDALKYENYRKMPGEKGALFRDNESGNTVIDKLNAAKAAADSQCIVVRRVKGSR